MILACLMLLTLLPVGVLAAGDPALNFELTADGGTSVGSILTVTFRILRTDSSGDYRLNAMQNEIEYDRNCFELVPGSIQLQRGGSAAARADERTDGTKIIAVNDMLADYTSSETICTFQLKVIGTNGTVRSSNTMAFSNDAENPKENLVRDASSNVTIGGGSQYDDKIHVTMRLIGAEQAENDVDLGSVKYLPDYVTWIPTTTYDLNKGSSVYDLWVMATDAAGIRSVGANKNYVSTVYAPDSLGGYALSEFSNGRRSGWMYTINGNHPGLGLKDQDLEDGDVVIWHYVNDYSYEVEDWFNEGQWQSLGDGTYYNRWLMAPDYFGGKGGGLSEGSGSGSPDVGENIGEGDVVYRVNDDGSETLVRKSLVEGKNVYTLLDPSVKIRLRYNAKEFDDAKPADWFADAVNFTSSHELFIGVSERRFGPRLTMTRAMLVTVLYRLEDTPPVQGAQKFTDVPAGTWYTDAVEWASENGIVKGVGHDRYAPGADVTREQIATMLFRYAQYLGMDVSGRSALSLFPDGEDTSSWARDAMCWAVSTGLVQGNADGTLNPNGNATRAEVATLMKRIVTLIVK